MDDFCTVLVKNCADPKARDVEGNTPMLRGIHNMNPDAAFTMEKLGGDPKMRNIHGKTPLNMVFMSGNSSAAAHLGVSSSVLGTNFEAPRVQKVTASRGV